MRHARRKRLLVPAVALAVLAVSLAGCGSSGSASSPGTAASSSAAAAGGTVSVGTASFVSIVEPFDPGHPARAESAPARCGGQSTAIEIERCYQAKTENVDAQIDVAQSARYSSATPAVRKTILAQDSAWLAARAPVCAAAFNTGGTIDGISAAACLLDESSARLAAVKGVAPPEARLKGTDSTDPNQLSWYTTPEGSRIAEISTQGDQTGGAVVAWVIVGGANGFVVNPRQFYFQDGSFTDPGVPEPSTPAYYRVPTGKKFEFDIDYSKLAKDPNADKSAAGYLYAPDNPVAVWA
ncbi:MAG TPA: lysozyme inhibitor LprI family protein [Streptosporangiaceae bacterium]|nr:lysozyme inhibitor LprI family protein [Streptosporangiaceae bacterium]